MVVTSSDKVCEHLKQAVSDGVWSCKGCGEIIPSEVKSREDFLSVRFNGRENLRQFRRLGKTEREFTRENVERFHAEKGYYPVREDGKDRWV